MTPEKFLLHIRERVLVFDGAMGSNLQTQGLTSKDFGGNDGCNEALNIFAPHAVRKVHMDFLSAGCRAIETNTFGATRITLKEYGLENRTREINEAAVAIAREALKRIDGDEFRFVTGSMGPTSKLPTLGQISFDEMTGAYHEQAEALWDAGVDLFLIETCQDILQTKCGIAALAKLFRDKGARRPLMVSVTLEAAGTMLIGSDIGAVQAILEPFDLIDVLGINCATGPLEMVRHVDYLTRTCGKPVSVMPNAGFPENVGGKAVYRLSPEEFARYQYDFVTSKGISIVGGCCGTNPGHIKALADAVRDVKPSNRRGTPIPSASSLFNSVSFLQEPPPCLIGERTNANGSRKFRDFLLGGDIDGMVAMGRDQARGGAHLVDLCVAYVGRNELQDILNLVPQFATQVKLPLVVDSTDPKAIEAALKRHGGRCIINSVNFEDGGKRLREVASLAKSFGAGLICLTIDEEGMARTAEKKLYVARRLFKTLTEEFGLRPCDLIFDPLTFTVGSGDVEMRGAAVETLKALELIKKEFPESFTILGVSNISFGLSAGSREVLNSVFLHEAMEKGLSFAIVNPAGITPIFKISPENKKLALNLLMNVAGDGSDLKKYIEAFLGEKKETRKKSENQSPVEEIRNKILDGDKTDLATVLDKLRKEVPPLEIVNLHLIPAMREVGDLFGRGETQLPFVLQSAEVMKAAVSLLEPHMEKKPVDPSRKMVLATVSGDVHDIGKNLVDILLTNNGFSVFNLGIKVDIDTMIKSAQNNSANVIGMSGLLVKSTQVMKENLEELNRRNLTPTVILGGAALTRKFVEEDLRPLYKGKVFYASDAFNGLKLMQEISDKNGNISYSIKGKDVKPEACAGSNESTEESGGKDEPISPAPDLPTVPDLGRIHSLTPTVEELLPCLDRNFLYRGRWRYRQGKMSEAVYREFIQKNVEPVFHDFLARDRKKQIFVPKIVFGYFPCRADGNSLVILPTKGRKKEVVFTFPRSRKGHKPCLSDYFRSDRDDVIVLWALTIGDGATELEKELYSRGEYRDYWHLHGLSVELAEAGAEYLEKVVRGEIRYEKRGLRYSLGYPTCPDLSQQKGLLGLLKADKIGIKLTENWLMVPEQSVSGIFVHHPQAKYFIP